tara:strand:+ start:118811 stop:119002 length:192 start_codon:yes stop_codon:yes gene_type:complete
MVGNAGKYVSMANGPMATNAPSESANRLTLGVGVFGGSEFVSGLALDIASVIINSCVDTHGTG